MVKNKGLIKLRGIWKKNPKVVRIMKRIYKNRKNFKLRDYTILK